MFYNETRRREEIVHVSSLKRGKLDKIKSVIIVDTMRGGGGEFNENRRHSASRLAAVGLNKVLRRDPYYGPDSVGPLDGTINNA